MRHSSETQGLVIALRTIYVQMKNDMILIVSVIDNLIKGAAGQAVQNMNLMFGFDESSGLRLKPVGY